MLDAAEALVGEVDRRVSRVRWKAPNAADHLRRSAESVLFNTGEGAAAFSPGTKTSCYRVAHREAGEVRAALRRLVVGNLLSHRESQRPYALAGALMRMLASAINSVESR